MAIDGIGCKEVEDIGGGGKDESDSADGNRDLGFCKEYDDDLCVIGVFCTKGKWLAFAVASFVNVLLSSYLFVALVGT